MLTNIVRIMLLIGPFLAISTASADPWKDESGHGKRWSAWQEHRGETPWWGRGKGYWDGHFKHGHWKLPYDAPPRYYYYEPEPPYYYVPPPDYYYYEDSWGPSTFEEELPPPIPYAKY